MIDWVSIVRHSRRRFSNYMYAVPNKVRRNAHQRDNPHATSPDGISCTGACFSSGSVSLCSFCVMLETF
jgi:hypothetical protein